MAEYGPFGLFLSAFAAATILPLSSEAALAAALSFGMEPLTALFTASAGNLLAILFNYGLGYWFYEKAHERLQRSPTGQRVLRWGTRYGYRMLLLSPLPVVGDPVTLAAGLFRLDPGVFLLIAGGLRVLRDWLILQFF